MWGDASAWVCAVTTDSRQSKAGSLFVPIEGPTFDGHAFIRAAFDGGAVAALTHQPVEPVVDHAMIRVEDTMKALADLARAYRMRFSFPIVAVTGSVGKTTTKDMLASALSTGFRVHKTEGNFNNEIGLPLTLFGLDRDCEMGIVEMGMNHFGEIHRLASMARPDVAVITNIGMSHIENLGSQEGILRAKLEVTDFFEPESLLVLNGDDPLLWKVRDELSCKYLSYGIENPACDYRAVNIHKSADSVEFDAIAGDGTQHIRCGVPGVHNVYNALASLAVARHFGLETAKAAEGIANFTPSGMRMDISGEAGLTLINDCYNASPASMKAALDVLSEVEADRRIAVLGDILEMGEFAAEAHRQVGADAAESGVDYLFTCGEHGALIAEGARAGGMEACHVRHFDTVKQITAYLPDFIMKHDAVLVKASRGMKFELVCECVQQVRQDWTESRNKSKTGEERA